MTSVGAKEDRDVVVFNTISQALHFSDIGPFLTRHSNAMVSVDIKVAVRVSIGIKVTNDIAKCVLSISKEIKRICQVMMIIGPTMAVLK
ncbi:MAG TPA: hypothetical protein VFD60_10905 [Nitrososphaeraceae archaeon]|nr:hypothetical protein [Nitrososphaeraceae archaeon]